MPLPLLDAGGIAFALSIRWYTQKCVNMIFHKLLARISPNLYFWCTGRRVKNWPDFEFKSEDYDETKYGHKGGGIHDDSLPWSSV